MIVIRYEKDDLGEILSEKEYNIEVIYDNKMSEFDKTTTSMTKPDQTYSVIYRALIDPLVLSNLGIELEEGDKVRIKNKEYEILSITTILYQNKSYLTKVEYGL